MIRVAVTGVGGGVGQSVMKALSLSDLSVEVVAIDVQPLSAGLYRADDAVVLPRPETHGALAEWSDWLRAHGVTALIPGSDHDLVPLAEIRDAWKRSGVCHVLVSNPDLVKICRDKALTVTELTRHGFPAPRSIWDVDKATALEWAGDIGYPMVIKPRDGFASRGVTIVRDAEELAFHFDRVRNPIVQEYLSNRGVAEEVTCSVFVDGTGEPVGTFMAQRELTGGATYKAEVVFTSEIDSLLRQIGRALKPRGPLNVQLRMTERGPVPFEINIRCSGTSAIRAHFGFNEAEMLLRHYVLGDVLEPPTVRHGYVLRYWNEVFLEGVGQNRLMQGPAGLDGTVRSWP